jgi:hypothetical protein
VGEWSNGSGIELRKALRKGGGLVNPLRCIVMRGLPKELEEEFNKFIECTPCRIESVTQSEYKGHVTVTVLYVLDQKEPS